MINIQYNVMTDQQLTTTHLQQLNALFIDAFEQNFSDDDFEHLYGGIHIIASANTIIIGHAALIPRTIHIDGSPYQVGYIEGVAVASTYQRQGIGAQIMRQITDMAAHDFVVAMLSTGEHDFYARFGWQRFKGESYVDNHGTIERTADEDEGLMVLTNLTHLNQPGIAWVCDWRTGDVW